MPVIDGVFVPRSALTPAELHVDFLAHDNHVLARRVAVERAALPKAYRFVAQALIVGPRMRSAHDALTETLVVSLEQTARFGYRQAQREIRSLRLHEPVAAAANPPAPASLAQIVRDGLNGVGYFIRSQAVNVTEAVVAGVMRALHANSDPTLALAAARKEALREVHRGVLDLVGTTLNLGRSVGAAELDAPPTFALRSEQLDKNTCKPCDELHGKIVRFGSVDYFAALPPTGCLGGGRCRGLMIFADGPRQVHIPELIAA